MLLTVHLWCVVLGLDGGIWPLCCFALQECWLEDLCSLPFVSIIPLRLVSEFTCCRWEKYFCSTSPWICRNGFCKPTLLQLLLWPANNSGRMRGGSQALWLCYSVRNADFLTTMASLLCLVPAQVTELSCSSYCQPLHEYSLNISAPLAEESANSNQISPFSNLSPRWNPGCEHWAARLCLWSLSALLPSHLFGFLPLVQLQIFQHAENQSCLYAEKGIFSLNYSCLNCWDFMERDQGDLSCHYISDVIVEYFLF